MTVPRSVLLVVLDDVGVEQFTAYGRGGAGTYGYPDTSDFTDWCAAGVKFTSAYGQQLCSPFRASLMTGRHPFRHGVSDIIRDDEDAATTQGALPESEHTIARELRGRGFRTACIGKWHLGNTNVGGREHPNRMGFDFYAGNLFNIDRTDNQSVGGTDFPMGYLTFDATVQGKKRVVNRVYHTTYCANEAVRWIKDQGARPYFLYLPVYGIHVPITNSATLGSNTPPTALYNSGTWSHAADVPNVGTQGTMHAARSHMEATIVEIQRVIDAVDLTTTLVIVTSDNGTDTAILSNEVDPVNGAYSGSHAKNTPYEPGINVPLVVFGAGVVSGGRTYSKLVSVVDIFPTILDMLGLPALDPDEHTIDGVSFAAVLRNTSSAAVRDYAYAEWFQPIGAEPSDTDPDANRTATEWAYVGERYVLLLNGISGEQEFYDLLLDPMQTTNLKPTLDASVSDPPDSVKVLMDAMALARRELVMSGAP